MGAYAAGAIASLHKAQPGSTPYPDGTHPSTQASLMLAVALYRDITGTAPAPKALRVGGPLLPVNAAVSAASPLEAQPALAGDGKVTVVPVALVEPLVKALPEPKGPGIAATPPEAMGKKVSITRWPVTIGPSGDSFSR